MKATQLGFGLIFVFIALWSNAGNALDPIANCRGNDFAEDHWAISADNEDTLEAVTNLTKNSLGFIVDFVFDHITLSDEGRDIPQFGALVHADRESFYGPAEYQMSLGKFFKLLSSIQGANPHCVSPE